MDKAIVIRDNRKAHAWPLSLSFYLSHLNSLVIYEAVWTKLWCYGTRTHLHSNNILEGFESVLAGWARQLVLGDGWRVLPCQGSHTSLGGVADAGEVVAALQRKHHLRNT